MTLETDNWRKLTPLPGRMASQTSDVLDIGEIIRKFGLTIGPFGQVTVAEYTPIIERSPRPGFSQLRDRTVPLGVNIPIVKGELEVDGTLGKVGLYTRKRGRYISGLIGIPGLRFRLATPNVGTYEYGYGDEFGNRFGLEWVNGEVFSFVESAGDRYYRKPRSEWLDPLDGTGPSGIDADLNGLVLRMPFGWYGGLTVQFTVAVPDRVHGDRLVVIDRSSAEELQAGVTLEEPNLPIFVEANGGVGYVGGRQYGVFGRYNPEFRVTSTSSVTKTGIGTTYTPIVSLKVKDEVAFRGVPVNFAGASLFTDESIEWAIFVDGTLTGASFGSIAQVPDMETALQADFSATALTGGYRVYSNIIFGDSAGGGPRGSDIVGSASVDLPDFNLPSDGIITLAARRIGAVDASVTGLLRVKEEN